MSPTDEIQPGETLVAFAARVLPKEVLSDDPDSWCTPTSDEVRLVVGRNSATKVTGANAARLVGITEAAFRKYLANQGSSRRHSMSFSAWHLLLHRLGLKQATFGVVEPPIKARRESK
jgi:hypothetical protein